MKEEEEEEGGEEERGEVCDGDHDRHINSAWQRVTHTDIIKHNISLFTR